MSRWKYSLKGSSGNAGAAASLPGRWSTLVGGVMVLFFMTGALFGNYGYDLGLYPYSPAFGIANDDYAEAPPSSGVVRWLLDHQEDSIDPIPEEFHLLGTDQAGRDVFIQVLHGAWTYLLPGIAVAVLMLAIGIPLGAASGYAPSSVAGSTASFLIALMDSFPRLIALMAVFILFDFDLPALVLGLSVFNASRVASIVRARVAGLVNTRFVEAAEELGVSRFRIIAHRLIWLNCRHALAIQMIYGMASLILVEATFTYLNVGTEVGQTSWGRMILEGMGGGGFNHKIDAGIYWQAAPPSFAIVWTLLGFYLLADGLERRLHAKNPGSR
ncbi:MAG: ABC transporter permease [Ignavibacteriae bacterium]|nr:ABC transporter permease [Ignavibacteriota bacterium]